MRPIFFLLLFAIHCSSTRNSLEVYHEPIFEKLQILSDEVCLARRLFLFPARPCVSLVYEKENASGEMNYYLKYSVGNFDVDLPVGVSLYLDGVYYNIRKSSTDYGETILVQSEIPEDLIPKFETAKSLTISYSNRRQTFNNKVSDGSLSRLQDQSKKMKDLLNQSGKMVIKKKY